MKIFPISVLCAVIVGLGCARLKVEAPKEPIKVDISMRLDIYQHVTKDINDIENIVSGKEEKDKKANSQSMLHLFAATAYAQESLDPEVEKAALSRKERRPQLVPFEEKGIVGENKSGFLEIRATQNSDASLEALVKAENNDRMIIYQLLAKKNGTSVQEVQKLYAKRLQESAPTGTPIEVSNESSGASEWTVKK